MSTVSFLDIKMLKSLKFLVVCHIKTEIYLRIVYIPDLVTLTNELSAIFVISDMLNL